MTATRILTMDDAIKVVVIDSLEQITTYVLEEQLDWFEDGTQRLAQNPQARTDSAGYWSQLRDVRPFHGQGRGPGRAGDRF